MALCDTVWMPWLQSALIWGQAGVPLLNSPPYRVSMNHLLPLVHSRVLYTELLSLVVCLDHDGSSGKD